VVTVACRLPLAMQRAADGLTSAQFWDYTTIRLPEALARPGYHDALTGRRFSADCGLRLAEVLDGQSVALPVSDGS
jgi:maltooligosyltrehalose synthase